MDLFEVIKLRRSTRAYTSEEVSDREIERLLEAARKAPSAGNIQPWHFLIVKNAETKRALAQAALDQHFIEEAPVVIIVCADENKSGQGYGSRGADLYCIQDAACWVGGFRENEVRHALSMPQGVRPVEIVPVGHPSERPHPRHKRPLREIVHNEVF